MKGYVVYIGLVDNSDGLHYVKFSEGLNIITGKSSTGKSAILHIFDYCMGSSRDTIPYGELTHAGLWFFTVLSLNESFLVLGRNRSTGDRYLREQAVEPEVDIINSSYFKDEYLIKNKSYYNFELSKYFGLNIDNVTEDTNSIKYRTNTAKDPTPSIRNIIPFILQHQNVIANKDSLFYGFDRKEKKEQTIEQFKIFAGFVDANYFVIKRELNDFKRRKRRLEINLEDKEDVKIEYLDRIEYYIQLFSSITGQELLDEKISLSLEDIFERPDRLMEKLQSLSTLKVDSLSSSNKASENLLHLMQKKNSLEVKRRRLSQDLHKIDKNIINRKKDYIEDITKSNEQFETKVPKISECPFCKSENSRNYDISNKLNEAICWLNNELSKSNYHIDSFEAVREQLLSDIEGIDEKIKKVQLKLSKLDSIDNELKSDITLDSQAFKLIGKLEQILDDVSKVNNWNDDQLKIIENKIENLNQQLFNKYNIDNEITQAELYINKQMKEIGKNFHFENALTPINLKFSLKTFKLTHCTKEGESIELSSMGSGANWLYSHLSLFLALHRYICNLGSQSIIPPILFLDQPTQVYFPTTKDDSNVFDAKEIAQKNDSIDTLDDDLESVTNIFNRLVEFCDKTEELTGIKPQVIVTDHADNLELEKGDFKDFVVAKWRDRGFIHPLSSDEKEYNNTNEVQIFNDEEKQQRGQLTLLFTDTESKKED